MRKVVILIVVLFALFTFINAFTSERTQVSKSQSQVKTL